MLDFRFGNDQPAAHRLKNAGSVAQNDVIVVNDSTKNSSYVQNTDMYYSNTDYSSYTQSSGEYYLDVEGKITSAIQKVLAEKKTKMYILKGHDEIWRMNRTITV